MTGIRGTDNERHAAGPGLRSQCTLFVLSSQYVLAQRGYWPLSIATLALKGQYLRARARSRSLLAIDFI